jgi:predicted nucleic acid-binding protein
MPETTRMADEASALMAAVDRGELEATTSEVVVHEVCYVLASKKHYQLPPADIAAYLTPLIQMPGLKLNRGEKRMLLRALEIYTAHPKLEFADSIIAARCELGSYELATFDKALGSLSTITRSRSHSNAGAARRPG